MSRSTRTLIAVALYVLAGFIAINHLILGADLGDWLLPLVLFVLGLVFSLYPDRTAAPVAQDVAEPPVLATPEAAPVPTLAAAPPPAPEPAPLPPEPAEPIPPVPVEIPDAEEITKAFGETEPVPPAVTEQHPESFAPVIDAGAGGQPAGPDDLTKIHGIGRKMQEALRAGGFDTYAKVAQASPEDLRGAIEAAGMRLAPNLETWPAQARDLMNQNQA